MAQSGKNYSVTLLLSVISIISYGQIDAGLKAALNLNHTQFDTPATYDAGVAGGAFCRYAIADFLQLNLEISYSQTGGGYDSGYYYVKPDVYRDDVNMTFHTVAAPLFVSATLPSLSQAAVKPLLLVGAEYAYSFSAVESFENVYRYRGEEFGSDYGSRDASADFSKHLPSMLFGAGADFAIHGMRTTIDVRYKIPFQTSDFPNGESGRFQTLCVNIGVSLLSF